MQDPDKHTQTKGDFRTRLRAAAQRNRERDRGLDKYAGRFSRFIWPFREWWLVAFAGVLCMMDFTTTCINLAVIRNPDVVESGPLAGWALGVGGFGFLFVVDVLVVAAVVAIARAARYFYLRSGLTGYARAAFVVVLLPYILRTAIVVGNNIAISILAR